MADNLTLQTTAATPPAGSILATDDVAGVHYPVGKLAYGVADSATLVSTTNGLPVAVVAGSANIGDVDVLSVPAPLSTTGGGTEAAALRVTIATDSTGLVSVDDGGGSLTIDGAVTATIGAGTANIGDVDVLSIAAGDNNIGNVDVVSLPALPTGTNNIGDVDILTVPAPLNVVGGGTEATALRVTIANNSTGVLTVAQATAANLNTATVGPIAHDIGVSGNPQVFAGAAQDSDDTAPPNRVSAESDTTRLATDRDGSLHVLPFGPQIWSYHSDGSTALTDATVHASPGAGLSLYVGTLIVSTGAATAMNVFFEEGATKVLGPYYLEAVAGRGLSIQFNPPKKITAATALTITTSASIAQSIDITGFTAQG